jgi:hypothetical protein
LNLALLLTQISNINKRHEEICKFSGEKFNIFDILNLSTDELSHSRMIAELLNPKGTHGRDSEFLKIFLDCIKIHDFSLNNVVVETEKSISTGPNDYDAGGRMDIVLTNDENQQIIIENKIHAVDQPNQLLRYHKYNPNAHLLYLTLYGTPPSEDSIGNTGTANYHEEISYSKHILKWLASCKIEAIDQPVLRESINQYIVSVKQLTGQARSEKMQKEYLDTILKDADNVSAAFIISQNIDEIKKQIFEDRFIPLISNLASKFGLDASRDPSEELFNKYWGFSFSKPEWTAKFKLKFQFEQCNCSGFIYALTGDDISDEFEKYRRSSNLHSSNYKSYEKWGIYQSMDHYSCWDEVFFSDLYSDIDAVSRVFENKIEELLSIAKDIGYIKS